MPPKPLQEPEIKPTEHDIPPIRAAAYVRMSTEHQQYSTSNQLDSILEYAARRNFDIVKVYSDEGKSGLNIQGRESFARMIADVKSSSPGFSCILVYDVSRWGRFQDADESAYYQYLCRQAGILVHYCAEQFENDGSPVSKIVTGVKRAMAGEYSRELSSKVFQGACRLIKLGYKQGGAPGYGLRRMLVDAAGQPKGLLERGQHKSIQTDRVVLIPGPDDEQADIRWIYQQFVAEGRSEREIAAILNARGTVTDLGRSWTRATVHQILTNEKYIGNNVYHRTSFKLKLKHVHNSPEKWVRAEGAWAAVVDVTEFEAVQGIIIARSRRFTDAEMLAALQRILDSHGRITGTLIDDDDDMPSSAAYRHRFNSLAGAYARIGYTPPIDQGFIETNRWIRGTHPVLMGSVAESLREFGAAVEMEESGKVLRVNDEIRVSVSLCRHCSTGGGSSRWMIMLDESARPDITIAARLGFNNDNIRDYYLLPSIDVSTGKLRLAEANGSTLDGYRFDDLGHFFDLSRRSYVGN
jgi:DNA invertase Pin-like site-specific DNA recombinase